ncbi:hypothetical protein C943_04212 [Mariniradius saccharolyticus AK6]|uniref:Uncharacterized protein n=1 Tax=Mariniradius saccharolyticus AK6 TaxID=1239962 RepID=M7XH96_9BACT|nr:hypothetical protein C943_04212 [Mariniradius saccharolyticus AK6]
MILNVDCVAIPWSFHQRFIPMLLFFLSKKVTNPDNYRETRKSNPRPSLKAPAGPADFHSPRPI